jgi:trehalose-phosphatase
VSASAEFPGLPRDFWERVAKARERLIVLDYDGTLAPFHVQRERAVPFPGAIPALRALCGAPRTGVAILSGRPVGDLLGLLGSGGEPPLAGLELLGEHGWERLRAGGLEQHELAPAVAERLHQAARIAHQAGFSAELEEKRTALVLHTRGLAPGRAREAEQRVERHWSPLTAGSELQLDRIDRGFELRATGRDKGSALAELLAEAPSGALLVYVGDDETDEDAFRQVGPHGFALRVAAEPRPTAADGTLASCSEVVRWLERLGAVPPAGA